VGSGLSLGDIIQALPVGEPAFEEIYLETVVPFRAWRYSPSAGELSSLVAPPYDVVSPELQSQLYDRSPHNAIRVDLGVTNPGDTESDDQYIRAASLLAEWKRSGVLVRDDEPSVTFVEEVFVGPDGQSGRRHGVLAAMRLTEFGEGVVFPHEHTLTGPKEDRFRLMTATAMSLSPVFLLYDLPGDDITGAWRVAFGSEPPAAATVDEVGNVTRLWPTTDPYLLGVVTDLLANARFLVADGHHRYETALRYREAQRKAAPRPHGSSSAFEYCLVYLANTCDPALAIYPTHRLLKGLPDQIVAALPRSLAATFQVERLGTAGRDGTPGAARTVDAQDAIAAYLKNHARGAFGLWGGLLDAPYGFCLAEPSKAHVSTGHSEAYQELDVAILQTLVLEKALGISTSDMAGEKHVAYFKDTGDAFARLQAGDFQVGFFMNATGLDQVCEVAFGGERMPQKTTFFYPKLPTGLVFHDLTGQL
jgi:uncharacterized protein (DUF1015 family)